MNDLADRPAHDDAEQYDDDYTEYEEYERARPPLSLGLVLTIGGILGLIASFTLSVERIAMLKDSGYSPTCSFDELLQCSTIMASNQAEIFGFPNPLMGLMAFPVIIVAGVLGLTRVSLPAWFWRWALVGSAYGVLFVGWLINESLYEIRALCPYCMVVWAVTIPIFWRLLGFTLGRGLFGDGVASSAVARVLDRWWWGATLVTYAVVFALIVSTFPWYFGL